MRKSSERWSAAEPSWARAYVYAHVSARTTRGTDVRANTDGGSRRGSDSSPKSPLPREHAQATHAELKSRNGLYWERLRDLGTVNL